MKDLKYIFCMEFNWGNTEKFLWRWCYSCNETCI